MTLPQFYDAFTGGLNSKDAPTLLTDNEARDLQNVQATLAGAIVKRNGLVTFSSPADTLHSLAGVESTASPFLVGAGNGKLYKVTAGGVSSSIKSGLNATARWSWVQAPVQAGPEGPVFGMNGVDTPQQWDGTAGSTSNWTATSGSVPNGTMSTVFGNRTWVAGVAANPSRLYFSDLNLNGGPVAWPTANVVDFDASDGQTITALGHVGPYLLVGKQRKLYVVYDDSTGANRQISDHIGIIAPRSVAQGQNGTYFLAEDRGVHVTNGTTVTPIADKIQPTVDSIVSTQITKAAGVCFGGHYYLSVCRAGTANDTVLDWDEVLQSWWLHTFGSNEWAIWHPTGNAQLFSAKPSAAVVDQAFVPNVTVDNGTAFKWRWAGPWQSPTFYRRRRFPTPYFRKRLRQVRIEGTGTLDVSLATDYAVAETLRAQNVFSSTSGTFGGSGTYGGAGTFGDTPPISRARLFSLGVANAFSLVFSSTSTTQDRVTSYVLVLADRRDLIPT